MSSAFCVLVVEDQPDTGRWLQALLVKAFPAAQVDLVSDLKNARRKLTSRPWQLVLVDLGLPDGSGLEIIREMRAVENSPPTVVITVHDDDDHLFSALAAGAEGYLLKEQTEDMLLHQLQLWRQGQPPLSPRMARRILRHFETATPNLLSARSPVVLTQRETEVLGCIGRGLRVHETARQLGIAESTVTTYIKSIYGKLNIATRAEAALEAARRGLA